MRYIIANCAKPTDHALHVGRAGHSMYSCVEDLERRICPGGRLGDRRIRECDDIATLVAEYDADEAARAKSVDLIAALEEVIGRPVERDRTPYDEAVEPDEPDYDEEYEADRAADRYEAWLFRD